VSSGIIFLKTVRMDVDVKLVEIGQFTLLMRDFL